jgi:hypothetical protein
LEHDFLSVGKGGRRFSRLRFAARLAVVPLAAGSALIISSAAFPTIAVDPAPPVLNPPLVGFSFSPKAITDGESAERALTRLLTTLQPDVVRLPVYWGSVAPTESALDYSEVDRMIATVQAHNAKKGSRHAQVVLVVGARNLVYPEVHLPGWLAPGQAHKLETLLRTPSYRRYLETTFQRYANLSLLRAWQVENEPLDEATSEEVKDGALPESLVRSEVDLLRSIDLAHEVVVTSFNSSHVLLDLEGASPLAWLYAHLPGPKPVGHAYQTLTMGDTLGLDLYVVTASTPLEVISPSTRISWKEEALNFWQSQAEKHGRALWITEMQATPWIGTDGFTVSDLLSSALAYRGHGVSVYLLWGVEDWLNSPEWMNGGLTAIKLLRENK